MNPDVHEELRWMQIFFILTSSRGSGMHHTEFYLELHLGELQVHTNKKRPEGPEQGHCPAEGP